MAWRASYRRWLLRDLQVTFVLLGGIALVIAVLTYEIDWSPAMRQFSATPQLENANNSDSEQRYTGSILIPIDGPRCWEGTFDNRTGKVGDESAVNCYEAVHKLAAKTPLHRMDMLRMQSVSKAFHHEDD